MMRSHHGTLMQLEPVGGKCKKLGVIRPFRCWLNSSIFVVWKCVLRGEVSFVLGLLFELFKRC